MTTDSEVIREAQRQPEAFVAIFDRHYSAIRAYAGRRVEVADADEIAAQTFVEAFDALSRYDQARSDAAPWLYGIAANLIRRHHRSEKRRLRAYARAAGAVEPQLDELHGTAAHLDALAARPRLVAALLELSPADREVLLLFAWADLGYEEIALALGIPAGTVRSRLNRARHRVRAELGSFEPLLEVCDG